MELPSGLLSAWSCPQACSGFSGGWGRAALRKQEQKNGLHLTAKEGGEQPHHTVCFSAPSLSGHLPCLPGYRPCSFPDRHGAG